MSAVRDTPSSAGRRPRVLVVALGRRGGTTQYGWLMTKGIAARVDVAVISSAAAENRSSWASLDAPHLEVETFSSIPTMLLSFLAVGRFARIHRFAREFGPDIIYYPHGHAWKPLIDRLLPRSAKTVLTVHDPELHEGEDSLLYRVLDRANRRRVDGYVLLNDAQRGAFVDRLHLDPARVAVLPLGVFDGLVESRRALADVPALASLAPWAGRYVLFAGRIRRYKGLGVLLAAYRQVADEVETPLVIAGEGALSDAESEMLKDLPAGRFAVIDRWLSDVEIASLVSSARFVVLPYLSATQSGIIPLASALGVPAIASDTGGVAAQVIDGRTGLLSRAGDADSLATQLRRAAVMGEADYGEMSSRAREHAGREWGWDGLARDLLTFCERLRDDAPRHIEAADD